MKQIITTAIILSRTDYGEADRILTLLTPDHGKLRLIAKGVRRIKSKLAGGIELFSVSDISYIKGRSDLGTLVSTRLTKHYGNIVRDVTRTMLGYDLIKVLNREIEDEPEAEYFELMEQAFVALDNAEIPADIVRIWFTAQILRLSGHTPNLTHDAGGARLEAGETYEFSYDDSSFVTKTDAPFSSDDIKFLRILFSGTSPAVIAKVTGAEELAQRSSKIVQFMSQQYIR